MTPLFDKTQLQITLDEVHVFELEQATPKKAMKKVNMKKGKDLATSCASEKQVTILGSAPAKKAVEKKGSEMEKKNWI